jgi:hypothetical protein
MNKLLNLKEGFQILKISQIYNKVILYWWIVTWMKFDQIGKNKIIQI